MSNEGNGVNTSEEDNKTLHNDLERKRRNELKNRFNALRDCIPQLRYRERAPKIAILKKGVELILQQQEEEKKLLQEKENERAKNLKLLRRLTKLAKQSKTV